MKFNENYQQGRADRERELLAASITSLSKKIAIYKTICTYFDLLDLAGTKRQADKYPRWIWVYLLDEQGFDRPKIHEITGYSYSNISKIIDALRIQMNNYPSIKTDIEHLRTRIVAQLCFNHTN